MPVACRNRRGFSAEKESHPHYQITGFSRSSGRGISYYGWEAKFILRSSKSHPLRQRAPLCTHSSFPETFVTALTLRSGKNAHTTRLQQFFTYPADEAPIYTKSKTCRQRGQVKYRFCRSRSLVKKRWKAAFSRRRASMLRE